VTTVRVEHIAFDAGTQIRAAINEQVVADYAEQMSAGAQFPPVIVFSDGTCREDGAPVYYLADGFHRTQAATRNGCVEIPADVRVGTKQDALWFALGANRANGQRLSEADKRHAIVLALAAWPDKPASEIAEQAGCGHSYVSRVRAEVSTSGNLPDRVTGKDGKSYPASRGPNAKSIEKREAIAALIRDGVPPSEIPALVRVSMTTVTDVNKEMGASVGVDMSKTATSQRRKDVAQMAERGFSSRQIAGAIGIGEDRVRRIAQEDGVVIHADRVIGGTRRHDSNRILERMALDATGLCADVDLIDFADVDVSRMAEWVESFESARKQLVAFISRMKKEQQKHGEAA